MAAAVRSSCRNQMGRAQEDAVSCPLRHRPELAVLQHPESREFGIHRQFVIGARFAHALEHRSRYVMIAGRGRRARSADRRDRRRTVDTLAEGDLGGARRGERSPDRHGRAHRGDGRGGGLVAGVAAGRQRDRRGRPGAWRSWACSPGSAVLLLITSVARSSAPSTLPPGWERHFRCSPSDSRLRGSGCSAPHGSSLP